MFSLFIVLCRRIALEDYYLGILTTACNVISLFFLFITILFSFLSKSTRPANNTTVIHLSVALFAAQLLFQVRLQSHKCHNYYFSYYHYSMIVTSLDQNVFTEYHRCEMSCNIWETNRRKTVLLLLTQHFLSLTTIFVIRASY